MWPWEHVLVAYVVLSAVERGRFHRRPGDWPVVALVAGSLFPDVVDKPLAWEFGLVTSGYTVAHSVFVAVPAAALVYWGARRRGTGRSGGGFVVGYLLHLAGDVVPASVSRRRLHLDPVLWPVGSHEPVPGVSSTVEAVASLLSLYVARLLAMEPGPLLVGRFLAVAFGCWLWVRDGRPGSRLVAGPVRRAAAGVRDR